MIIANKQAASMQQYRQPSEGSTMQQAEPRSGSWGAKFAAGETQHSEEFLSARARDKDFARTLVFSRIRDNEGPRELVKLVLEKGIEIDELQQILDAIEGRVRDEHPDNGQPNGTAAPAPDVVAPQAEATPPPRQDPPQLNRQVPAICLPVVKAVDEAPGSHFDLIVAMVIEEKAIDPTDAGERSSVCRLVNMTAKSGFVIREDDIFWPAD